MEKNYNWKKHKGDIIYKTGDKVLYFIGDRNHNLHKLREKWSGPWIVSKMKRHNTVVLTDENNDYVWNVHTERVKKYIHGESWGLETFNRKVGKGEIKELNNVADRNDNSNDSQN